MTIEEVEYTNLKELYEAIKDGDSSSYKSFLKKLNRLAETNPQTIRGIRERLGLPVDRSGRHTHHEFLAFDGEGWDNKYVLLANSFGERIVNSDGLSTLDCLDFLNGRYDEPTKRIFFSFSYDVNHILRDIPDSDITDLLRGRSITYEGHRLSYTPGKIFVLNGLRYYDVFGFFQKAFVKVIGEMLGEQYVSDKLVEGKEARGTFKTWDINKIIKYNDEELQLLVAVMDKLRDAFNEVGVFINEWYGPGAVAKYWYRQHEAYPREVHTPEDLLALNSAYYGGRFEQISLGKIDNVYEYDIHSAYPAVMAEMPNFLQWRRVKKFQDNPYSIWHISFDLREDGLHSDKSLHSYLPLPMRSRDGRICYPLVGKGWYWYSEVKNALDFFPSARITFHEGYIADTEGRPFGWVGELYDYRQRLKAAGSFAQYPLKVGLNSLYGKTAQRVGKNDFFSLAWAGYITAETRAKLARVGYENGRESIIGFATDALFSREPLKLRTGSSLGEWEESRFASSTFFQSGVYRLVTSESDKPIDRYRGSPLRRGIDDIVVQLTEHPHDYPKVKIGRFISHMLAIKAPEAYGPYRLQFVSVQHALKFDAPYKRHYTDFLESIGNDGTITSDFSRLLRQEIHSLPKVYMDDNNPFAWSDLLYGNIGFSNIESYPQPSKDRIGQQLIDEGIVAAGQVFDDIEDLGVLPVVEDDTL